MLVMIHVRVTVEFDLLRIFGPRELPGIAMLKPLIRRFHLKPIHDPLVKDPIIIAYPVSVPRNPKRRHGIKKTSRQTSQTAVSESRVHFFFANLFKIKPEFLKRFLGLVHKPKIQNIIPEKSPDQEFQRKIIDPLEVLFMIALLRLDPAFHQTITERHPESHEIIMGGCGEPVLGKTVLETGTEGFLEPVFGHILVFQVPKFLALFFHVLLFRTWHFNSLEK